MAYTSTDQVRRHLLTPGPLADTAIEQAIVLTDTDWVTFYTGPVLGDSLHVYRRREAAPTRLTTKLTNGTVVLPVTALMPDSVHIANNSSLAEEYIENDDFVVDYATATISRKSNGQLTENHAVTIWYRVRTEYQVDEDYQVEWETGRVRRLAGGAIGSGETVTVRYQPQAAVFPDDIVAQATAEANQFIAATIDPNRDFGANPHLALAATYHAVAIICHIVATRDLISRTASGALASAWLALAKTHHDLSQELIDSFRPPLAGPSQPRAV